MTNELIDVPHIGGGQNLRQQIGDVLRASVIAGRMRAGAVYSAPALAQRFGVSATPVREAMLDLVAEGLVEPVRNKGFRVTELSGTLLDEITATRLLLEVPTVASLAASLDDRIRSEIDELYPAARRMVRLAEKRDAVGFVELDRTFHLSVLALAGNDTLAGIVGNLRARSRLTGLADLDLGELVASASEHVVLLDLILAGDPAAVAELMTRHINHVRGIWAGFRSVR
jgi:DNA-binding GntR family transcriptional regulator